MAQNDAIALVEGANWAINAFTSNLRYTNRAEKTVLDAESRSLGLPQYDRAALIPIKKSAAWWALPQDERRQIFEEDSKHIAMSRDYLSVISRRLHHCRDLGEPFDFLTWFEFAAEHEAAFDDLCSKLRQSREWQYVEREIDIRLSRVWIYSFCSKPETQTYNKRHLY
jgi:chlorite dismutase